jgi:small-conductance mechanosensitive channel
MQNLNELLRNILDLNLDRAELQTDLLQTALIIVVLWLLRFVIVKVVNYETKNLDTRYWWAKITSYVVFFVGLILVGRIWIGGTESLITFLGLVSAGLAIALAGPVTDLAGWIYVLSRRPFVIGDRIQIGDYAGDVIDIRVIQFAVLEIGNWVEADQSTGRIVHIPYRKIFTEVLANYSEGFDYIWNEIPVMITFESNWEKAKAMFQDIADRHAGDLPGRLSAPRTGFRLCLPS